MILAFAFSGAIGVFFGFLSRTAGLAPESNRCAAL